MICLLHPFEGSLTYMRRYVNTIALAAYVRQMNNLFVDPDIKFHAQFAMEVLSEPSYTRGTHHSSNSLYQLVYPFLQCFELVFCYFIIETKNVRTSICYFAITHRAHILQRTLEETPANAYLVVIISASLLTACSTAFSMVMGWQRFVLKPPHMPAWRRVITRGRRQFEGLTFRALERSDLLLISPRGLVLSAFELDGSSRNPIYVREVEQWRSNPRQYPNHRYISVVTY